METLYVITHLVLSVLLFIVTSIRPPQSNLSRFELSRRAKSGDRSAKKIMEREEKVLDIISLQRVVGALVLTVAGFMGVEAYGLSWGIVAAILLALGGGAIAKLWPFHRVAHLIYAKLEPKIIYLIDKFPIPFRLIRGMSLTEQEKGLNSKEELIHLIGQSGEVLTNNEKKFLQNGLAFDGMLVSELMIPMSKVHSVKKSDVLGPVVLNDLHNSGHSHFPVTDGGSKKIVGILNVQDLLVISGDSKSSTVESAMDKAISLISPDHKLDYALVVFLKNKCHFLVVEDHNKEQLGILTLKDVVEKLFGRRITSEVTEDEA